MKKGPWLVLSTYVMWGILPIYWKLLAAVNPIVIVTQRIVWSFIFGFIILLVSRHVDRLRAIFRDKALVLRLAVAAIMCVFNWVAYIYAVNTDRILDASLAYYLNPIMTVFLGALIFRERLHAAQWVAVILAACGVAVPMVVAGEVPWLALIIGGSWAVYGAIKKTVVIDGVTSLTIETGLLTLPTLVFLGFFAGSGTLDGIVPSMWVLLSTAGIMTALPMMIYSNGIQTTSYSLAGILMYINPTLQLLCGVLLYGEPFTTIDAVMFGFVWLALILYVGSMLLDARRQARQHEGVVK